jgi:hypothetical protein
MCEPTGPERYGRDVGRVVIDELLHGALGELRDAALDTVDPGLLELCRSRIALLIGLGSDWSVRPLSERERACIDLTEQFVLDVAGITDAQVAAVVDQLGADGAMEFVFALLVVEQRLRMQAMWTRLGLAVTP